MLLPVAAVCQQKAPQAAISNEWDTKTSMAALVTDVKKLEPVVRQVKPENWVAKGAPDAYIRQFDSSIAALQALIASTEKLQTEPDRLLSALDAFFRMERMEMLLTSLKEGARKYQNQELADRLTSLIAGHSIHRDKLRQHIMELAAAREQEFLIADQEAQRCRSTLSHQETAEPKPASRRNRAQERK